MSEYQTSYYKFDSPNDEDAHDDEVTYLMHVPDKNKALWHHIEDLDGFFTRVYKYHQNHGFFYSFFEKFLQLVKYAFLTIFTTLLVRCVNFDILYANTFPPGFNATSKLYFKDVLYSGSECSTRISGSAIVVVLLVIAAFILAVKTAKFVFDYFHLMEIKRFYTSALRIKPNELDDLSWQEVQQRLMMVQKDQQMCIHKQTLTELDIYNRILRFDNYLVAMANKGLLPPRFHLPLLGEVVFFTDGLKINIEWLFFWGLRRFFFASSFHMKDEFKVKARREQLASRLSYELLLLGAFNLLFMPLIFGWQVLYTFFRYADMLKREPGAFTARKWSAYGRLYLRHFNELPHEFRARLNRGYKPATAYMETFASPILALFAKTIAFMAASMLAVIIALTLWDIDVLDVEHLLVFAAALSFVVHFCSKLIPDQHAVSCPEQLMRKVLAQIHYSPDSWRSLAHTYQVRDEFSQIFQYKAVYILEEVLSPIITPFILIFWMRKRSLEFVDFFRNFTVDIAGVGDVCSFAQLDINKHGDPKWHDTKKSEPNYSQQADDGKVELSLMHFAVTNPKWTAPQTEDNFLSNLKVLAQRDAAALANHQTTQNPLLTSLQSLEGDAFLNPGMLQHPGSMIMSGYQNSLGLQPVFEGSHTIDASGEAQQRPGAIKYRGAINCEGPVDGTVREGLITSVLSPHDSMMGGHPTAHGLAVSTLSRGGYATDRRRELASLEMSVSALFMHELHHQRLQNNQMWETIPDYDDSSYHGNDNQSSVIVRTPPSNLQPSTSRANYNTIGVSGEDIFGHLRKSDESESHDRKSPVSGSHDAMSKQPFLTMDLNYPPNNGNELGEGRATVTEEDRPPQNLYLHEDSTYHDSNSLDSRLPQSPTASFRNPEM